MKQPGISARAAPAPQFRGASTRSLSSRNSAAVQLCMESLADHVVHRRCDGEQRVIGRQRFFDFAEHEQALRSASQCFGVSRFLQECAGESLDRRIISALLDAEETGFDMNRCGARIRRHGRTERRSSGSVNGCHGGSRLWKVMSGR
jgi:hypothetical protein